MMKRILSFALSCALALSLTACGSTSGEPQPSSNAAPSQTGEATSSALPDTTPESSAEPSETQSLRKLVVTAISWWPTFLSPVNSMRWV